MEAVDIPDLISRADALLWQLKGRANAAFRDGRLDYLQWLAKAIEDMERVKAELEEML